MFLSPMIWMKYDYHLNTSNSLWSTYQISLTEIIMSKAESMFQHAVPPTSYNWFYIDLKWQLWNMKLND